jgi:RNA polymerase sigma-70 factor (ECF subfamily)
MEISENEGSRAPGHGQRSFQELWARHERHLFHLCIKQLKNEDAADEAMSRVAIKAWQKMPEYDSIPQPRALLCRITLNVCIDIQREQGRQNQRHIGLDELSPDSAWLMNPKAGEPDARLAERELRRLVLRILRKLPRHSRACARLAFIQQLPANEIAKQLELKPANVRKIIERTRNLLRSLLVEAGVMDEGVRLRQRRARL